jgi:hypothetical protein
MKDISTMAKRKRTNNDLQNIHIKKKDPVTRTPLKTHELGKGRQFLLH